MKNKIKYLIAIIILLIVMANIDNISPIVGDLFKVTNKKMAEEMSKPIVNEISKLKPTTTPTPQQ